MKNIEIINYCSEYMNNGEFESICIYNGKVFYFRNKDQCELLDMASVSIHKYMKEKYIENNAIIFSNKSIIIFPDMEKILEMKRKEYLEKLCEKVNQSQIEENKPALEIVIYYLKPTSDAPYSSVCYFDGKFFYHIDQEQSDLQNRYREMISSWTKEIKLNYNGNIITKMKNANTREDMRVLIQKNIPWPTDQISKSVQNFEVIRLYCYYNRTEFGFEAYVEYKTRIYYSNTKTSNDLKERIKKMFPYIDQIRLDLQFIQADPEQIVYLHHIKDTMDVPHVDIDGKGTDHLIVRYMRGKDHKLKGYFQYVLESYFVQGRDESDILLNAHDKLFKLSRNHSYKRIDLRYLDAVRNPDQADQLTKLEDLSIIEDKEHLIKKINDTLFPKPEFVIKNPWLGKPWPVDQRAPNVVDGPDHLIDPALLVGLNWYRKTMEEGLLHPPKDVLYSDGKRQSDKNMSPNPALYNTYQALMNESILNSLGVPSEIYFEFTPTKRTVTISMCYYIQVKEDKSLLIEAYCTFREFMFYAIGQTISEVEMRIADKINDYYQDDQEYNFILTVLFQVNDNLVKFRKELAKSSKGAKSLIYKI